MEENARLTGTTGLLLLVMLAAEGLTIVSIRPLLAWHIAIGLALIPPVLLKLGSTFWRFGHYYLGDSRYRRAGPPVPVLRILGPIVSLTTVLLLGSGVTLWLAGPSHRGLLTLHQASFFVWVAFMTIHVLAHLWRAGRLARADIAGGGQTGQAPYGGIRQTAVLASLVAGLIVAVLARGAAGGLSGWSFHGYGGH